MKGELRIFISYRRSDCQPQANALYDGLKYRLPSAQLFMDIDSIPPGVDFEQHIQREIEQCDLVLVMIGDNWLDPRPGANKRRIDEKGDFVRLEVESALASKTTRLIPILVEGAMMPSPSELPRSIQRLTRFNAFELSDQKWPKEIRDLAEALADMEPTTSVTGVHLRDIDDDAVRRAIQDLGQEFSSRDVSEHPTVGAAHGPISRKSGFHGVIGRYLAQNQAALGVTRLEGEDGSRGARWQGIPMRQTPPPPPPTPPVNPRTFTPPPPPQEGASRPALPWVIGLATCCTAGLVAPAVPLWVASRRPHDSKFKQRMYSLSAGILVSVLVGFAFVGSAPTDDEGTPVGAAANIGMVLVLLGAAGAFWALWFGRSAPTLPGAQAEMQRRTLRAQYRQLAEADQGMAVSMRVGRPDLARDYDDGGLLHLNSLDERYLVDRTPLRADEVHALVSARRSLGRFSSFEEISGLVSGLDASSIEWLREHAVFY